MRRERGSSLFPYTTLFRSAGGETLTASDRHGQRAGRAAAGGEGERRGGGTQLGQTRANGLERAGDLAVIAGKLGLDRKSTRLNSSHSQSSYAVFCVKKQIG